MRIVMFYHSLRSDWNHGNAHFLRGVAAELLARGHDVAVYEPRDAWSAASLAAEHGPEALEGYRAAYPDLDSILYDLDTLDLDEALDGADLVLVHEWNAHELVARVGRHRATLGGYLLLFHDTHHRAVTDASSMARYDLRDYDDVLAFGAAICDVYRRPSRCSCGTRRPTSACSLRCRTPRARAIWCGSATGATTSAPRSCTSS
jgi:spore maturation protein CgeB